MRAKLIKHIPSKKGRYWDKYEFECIDCGKHYFSGHCDKRTNPYCGDCNKIHQRERQKAQAIERQKKHDAEIINTLKSNCIVHIQKSKPLTIEELVRIIMWEADEMIK